MATHSSILAGKIPWTAEPGRFLSMGLQSQTRLCYFTADYSLLDYSQLSAGLDGVCL